MLLDLTRPFNGTSLGALDEALADFAGRPLTRWSLRTQSTGVPADVLESKDEIQVRLDLPGHKPDEIDIKLEDDVLTVTSERKPNEAAGETYHRSELAYGVFSRSFTLPATVDPTRTDAKYDGGVLTIHLPKREEAKPRKISVKAG